MRLALAVLVVLAWSNIAQAIAGSICQAMTPSPQLEMFVDNLPRLKKLHVSNGKQLTLGAYKIHQGSQGSMNHASISFLDSRKEADGLSINGNHGDLLSVVYLVQAICAESEGTVTSMKPISVKKLHRDLPPTALYAYGVTARTATYPGPTLEAIQGVPAHVRWENHIRDAAHMFTVDPTVMWANPTRGGVPIVTHLHGAAVASSSDGHPEAWFTAFGDTGSAYTSQSYTYPNEQRPTMLWYHDHALGITRLNILAGLTGVYIIRPKAKPPAWMPRKRYEVTLVLQDKALYANGSVNFPTVGLAVDSHPHWCPEYFGDVILVNGKAWPYLVVKPRKYRFRMVNAGNARVYELELSNPNASVAHIGSDGGLLERPYHVDTLTVAPAERVDVIIDFSSVAVGETVTLRNAALVPYPDGDPAFTPPSTRSVMQFKVTQDDDNTKSSSPPIPEVLRVADVAANLTGALRRTLTMIERADANDFPTGSLLSNLTWTDPVTEMPSVGATEVWEFVNLTPDAHPMHIHLVKFKVLELQAFNQTLYEDGGCHQFVPGVAGSCISGEPVAPMAYHAGWKDTVLALPGLVTRLVVQWSPASGHGEFPFDVTAAPGYLWHCHILDHEDNEMMRPIQLVRR